MTKDEALELALEALDIVKIHFTQNRHVNEAITAIKQARALDKKAENARELGLDYEPVQEPFCFFYVENEEEYFAPKGAYVPDNAQPLYTTPPAQPAVPLTDEQIDELSRTMVKGNKSVNWLCRAIEAAHGITKGQP